MLTVRVRAKDTRGFVIRDALVFVRSTPSVTTGGDRQVTTTNGWVTYQLAPNGNFPRPRKGVHVQFFVKAYRSGDPALAGVAAYRLVQVRLAGGWKGSQRLLEPFECGPTRVRVALEVLVRLDVEVLPAHGAQPGAVRPAEDLVRKL